MKWENLMYLLPIHFPPETKVLKQSISILFKHLTIRLKIFFIITLNVTLTYNIMDLFLVGGS